MSYRELRRDRPCKGKVFRVRQSGDSISNLLQLSPQRQNLKNILQQLMQCENGNDFLKSLRVSAQQESYYDPGARALFEEVIRKDYEVIRHFLLKISDIYSRQDDYDAQVKALQEKMSKLSENNQNFQYQFRTTYLEVQRRQIQFTNEVSNLRNILRIPATNTPFEAYLDSEFFKQQTVQLNSRRRQARARTNKRHCTNYTSTPFRLEDTDNSIIERGKGTTAVHTKHSKNKSDFNNSSRFHIKEEETFPKLHEDLNTIVVASQTKQLPFPNSPEQHEQMTAKLRDLQSKYDALQLYLLAEIDQRNSQLCEKLQQAEKSLGGKLEELARESKQEWEWNHIDFEEVQRYIEIQVGEKLSQKVGKSFLEESMNNLKSAWEEELKQVYMLIDAKLRYQDIAPIQDKLQELLGQIEQMTPNPTKINKISFNSTPSRNHRDSLQREKDKEDDKPTRHTLTYSNSLTLLRNSEDKRDKDLSAKQWREKVTQSLGLVRKRIRRGKAPLS